MTGPDLGVAVEQDEDAVLGPQLGHAQHAGAPGLGTRVALSPGHGHCGARGLQRPADAVRRVETSVQICSEHRAPDEPARDPVRVRRGVEGREVDVGGVLQPVVGGVAEAVPVLVAVLHIEHH